MENKENIKSFEQLAKDAQSKKRMQELAGIFTTEKQKRSAEDILLDMIEEIKKIGKVVSTQLKKKKEK